MFEVNLASKSQNAVTRKTGSLNLARMANAAAGKPSIPALTGHIPRRHHISTVPYSVGLDQADENQNVNFPESFCLTGTAMNPKPRQVSPLFLAGKTRSYVSSSNATGTHISSSNAEDSDANNSSSNQTSKKRKYRRRKRSKSLKNTKDVSGDGNAGTQKVVKMLQDGSLLLCRVPILNSTPIPRGRKTSRSKSRSSSRGSKSPVSPAARVQHQLAKSVVCFAMKTPHEPICFTVKRDNQSRRSSLASYYYHDEHLCNRCRMLKKKRALRASLRAPKYKNFGVQTDIKSVPVAEKPCPPLNPLPAKAVIISRSRGSPDAEETPCTPQNLTIRNKPTASKSGNHDTECGLGPKLVTTNPTGKTTPPGCGNHCPPRHQIKAALVRNSLSKEIVIKSRMQHDTSINEVLDQGHIHTKDGIMRLRNLGRNKSLFLVGPNRACKTDIKNLVSVGDVCKVSA